MAAVPSVTPISVCIVGMGFRGLGVLERIIAFAREHTEKALRVYLIDPSERGPEQYAIDQHDYLLLNIVCAQVSVFPDVASVKGCSPTSGPTLYEWVRDRGLLIAEDGMTVGSQGRPVEPGDFLPRRILGEYLLWSRDLLISMAPSSVEVIPQLTAAIDITSTNHRLVVQLANGSSIPCDYLFLAVGQVHESHSTERRSLRQDEIGSVRPGYIDHPYPLPAQLASITPDETVAIAGLGLSAVDAILSLTIGRGGRMLCEDGIFKYIPSGEEPQIIAFSRSGLPYRSRPTFNAPLTYDPVVFNRGRIDALRRKRGKLDFDRDVLPLLFAELRVAYWRARQGRDYGWDTTTELVEELRQAAQEGRLDTLFKEGEAEDSSFDPQLAYFGSLPAVSSSVLANSEAYQQWFCSWLKEDLAQATLGIAGSPLKAALEACREFRDVIRYAVDFGGLTDESLDRFFSFHAETINRIVVGPQKERTADILALIDAGFLQVSLGPNPTVSWDDSRQRWKLSSASLHVAHEVYADVLYRAVTNRAASLETDHSIVGAMARRGRLRPFRPHSKVIKAVDVDRSFHPFSRGGIVDKRIWILGLLCEGVTFYNGYVTSPGKFVRSQYDADQAVAEMFSRI